MKHTLRLFICTLLMLATFTACEYKELCYDHSHIVNLKIKYNWQNDPSAVVKGMSLMLYNMDKPDADPIRYDLPGMEGGTIRVEKGRYKILSYNYDTEAILYSGTRQIETFEAYTRKSSLEEGTQMMSFTRGFPMPMAASTENQPIVLEPDLLWAGTHDVIDIEMGQEDTEVTIYPEKRSAHVQIVIKNVPNLQYTGSFGGSMSGMAGSVMMASGKVTDSEVVIPFVVKSDGVSTLTAEFNTFGHCPFAEDDKFNTHILTIYAVLADGTKWYYTIDVTEQMHDPAQNPDQENIYIELKDLPVPKPIVNGSGFKPTIDGWNNEEILVGM